MILIQQSAILNFFIIVHFKLSEKYENIFSNKSRKAAVHHKKSSLLKHFHQST